MKRPSQRFQASFWTRYLIPLAIGLILLALASTIIFIVLFALGLV